MWTCGPKDIIISLDFKETSVYEQSNNLLPPSFPNNLKNTKIPEDSKKWKKWDKGQEVRQEWGGMKNCRQI